MNIYGYVLIVIILIIAFRYLFVKENYADSKKSDRLDNKIDILKKTDITEKKDVTSLEKKIRDLENQVNQQQMVINKQVAVTCPVCTETKCPTCSETVCPANFISQKIYGVNNSTTSGDVYTAPFPCPNNNCAWEPMPNTRDVMQIEQTPFDLWALTTNTNAWKCQGTCPTGEWTQVPATSANQLQYKNGYMVAIGSDSNIYTCPHSESNPCNGTWTQIGQSVSSIN